MRDPVMERGRLGARHDFDMLPRITEIEVLPALSSEFSAITDMANRLVPGLRTTEQELERCFTCDPESVLTFRQKKKLLGAVAFLYLNRQGYDALMHNDITLANPESGLIAGRCDEVSAIYVRAIVGQGRAMAGLGNVSKRLSEPRLASADLYAQPASAGGRNLMMALGFEPVSSHQRELWRYQRPWNRIQSGPPASIFGWSFADARH
jgi:hypothetical protein